MFKNPKVKKWSTILLATFAGIILVGTIVVKVVYTPERISAMLVPPMEEALGREVTVKGLSASFFPYLGVKVSGLTISNSTDEAFSRTPFLSLKTFRVKIAFLPLLKGDVVIDDILLDKMEILVEKGVDGRFNYEDMTLLIPDTTKEKKPLEPIVLPVRLAMNALSIKNSTLLYIDHKTKEQLTIGSVDHKVSLTSDEKLENLVTHGKLVLTDVTFEKEGKPTFVKKFKVELSHALSFKSSTGILTLKSLKLALQQVALEMTGTISDVWTLTPQMDLKIVSEPLTLSKILAEIPVELVPELKGVDARGTLSFDVAIKGPFEAPVYEGGITLKEGYIKQASLPKALSAMEARVTFDASQLNVEKLNFSMGKSPFALRLLVKNFAAPIIDGELHADMDMDEVSQVITLPPATTLGGRLVADVRAQGAVNVEHPETMDISGKITFKEFRAKTKELLVPAVVNGALTLSAKEILGLVRVTLGSSDIESSLRITEFLPLLLPQPKDGEAPRAKVVADVASKRLIVPEFLAPAPAPTPTKTAAPVVSPEKGVLTPMVLLPADLWLKGSVGTLVYDAYTLSNLKLSLQNVGKDLDLTADGGIYSGSLSATAKYIPKNEKEMALTSKIVLKDVSANEIISTFNNQVSEKTKLNQFIKTLDNALYGKLNFQADLTTYGRTDKAFVDNLTGTFKASVAEGVLKSNVLTAAMAQSLTKFMKFSDINFNTFGCNVRMQDGSLIIDSMSIKAPAVADWFVYGTTKKDGTLGVNVEARLNKALSAPLVKMNTTAQGAATSAINTYLGGTGLDAVAKKEIAKRGVAADAEGRVTLLIDYGGSLDKPAPRFKGFKEVSGGTAPTDTVTTSTTKETITQAQEQVKAEVKKVEQQVNTEVKKAETQVIKEVEKVGGPEATKEVKKVFKQLKF